MYFVAGGEWTRLPDVLPKHITAARKIRKMFSGDLNRKVCKTIFMRPFISFY